MKIKNNKPFISIPIGSAMTADFYKNEKKAAFNYLRIYAFNGAFDFKIVGFPYSFLLHCVEREDYEEVANYAMFLWRFSQEIYQDEQFAKDVLQALDAKDRRTFEAAQNKSAQVSETKEQMNQAVMEDIAEYADIGSDEARREFREYWKEEIKNEAKNEGWPED